jgi:POT family proton-dependent oligopeptide transporter
MSTYLTAPRAQSTMPKGIPYIISNEAAERFSFYGMKGILVVFMTQYLHMLSCLPDSEAMSSTLAQEYYHLFTAAVYGTPILGAILSDVFLGKYRTIIALSMVYCAGHASLAMMGTTGNPAMWLLMGLGLIALGSGGIKPCVSAHVGDQFGQSNSHLMTKVFNWFYFSINLGAFTSTLMTPWLLEWYGPHWAFGIPGVLMALATIVFWMGRKKFIHVPPGGMAFIKETFSGEGIRALLKLMIIFLFVAIFWSLFDQTGSAWVIQAEDMDRNWLGMTWLSSQIQAINPIMILVFIPVFTYIVYPIVGKFVTVTPMRKISTGLFITVGSFAIIATAQGWIAAGEQPSIAWQVIAYAVITAAEVLVSITCLQFAYTQSPRKMKSFVMALFLMSVMLGNLFAAGVNAIIQTESRSRSIQVASAVIELDRLPESGNTPDAPPSINDAKTLLAGHHATALDGQALEYATTSDGGYSITAPGYDGIFETADDIRIGFGPEGTLVSFETESVDQLTAAGKLIDAYWADHGHDLPGPEVGTQLIASQKDPWGKEMRYEKINRKLYRITSDGPDGAFQSSSDVVFTGEAVNVKAHKEEKKTSSLTWIERQREECGFDTDPGGMVSDSPDPSVEGTFAVGGQDTMSPATKFWFFTYCMLGTAILFVFVAMLYKPKEYIMEEQAA